MSRILHSLSNRPLLLSVYTSNPARKNFPLIVQEALQELDVCVVDVLNPLNWIALFTTARIALLRTKQSVVFLVAVAIVVACHVTSRFNV